MSGSSNACHLTRHNIDFVSMSSLFRVTSPMLGWSRNGHLQPCIRVFQLQLNNTQKPGCRYVQTLARASLNPHNVSDQSSRCISSQSRSGLGSGGFFKSRLLLKPSHQNVLPTRLQLLLQARSLSTVSGSLLLYRKSTFNDTLRSNLVLQFIRTFGRTRPRLNPQDPPTEHPLVAHSLDFRTLRWTLPRGLRLSLPILALYLLFYLVLLIPEDSSWRQRALSVAVQYGTYRKHECFQRLNSPITYLTSQFFHDNPKTLIVDSIALIGIATVLGPSIGAKTFFILYLLGGFIGANVDCPWKWVGNPLRRLSGLEYDEKIREGQQLVLEKQSKQKESRSKRLWDIFQKLLDDFKERREHPEIFRKKGEKQAKLINEESTRIRRLSDFAN